MKSIQDSYIYAMISTLGRWFSHQWQTSLLVGWLTGQPLPTAESSLWGRGFARLDSGYRRIFEKLGLPRLFKNSIFLHPAIFVAGAMILAPLMPTMAILALVCGSFFSMLMRMGADRKTKLSASPIDAYVVLFAVAYLYATVTSTTFKGSLFPGLLTAAFVLFFFAVSTCCGDKVTLNRILAGLMAAGAVVAMYGFYQFLFPYKFQNVWTDTDMFSSIAFRVYSTLENPNVLGEYFLLIIPLGCALVLNARSLPKRLVYLAITGIMGVCLVLTYSRGCYLGLLFAGAVFLALLDRRFLLVGIVAVALCPLYLPQSVLSRFTSIGNMGDTSTSYRVYIWLATLAMMRKYWFCGIGPGSEAFNTIYPEYAYSSITAPHSHNLYLQILCDTGVCGIAIFVMLIVAFYRMMFTAINRETDRQAKHLQIAGTSAITGFLVQSMTDYTFYNYRVMLMFWVVMGLCVVFTRIGCKKEANR